MCADEGFSISDCLTFYKLSICMYMDFSDTLHKRASLNESPIVLPANILNTLIYNWFQKSSATVAQIADR